MANIIVFFVDELVFGSTENTEVLIACGGAYVPYIENGQVWRLFTAMFIHSGIRHLLNNMVVLYVLGEHLEHLIGSVKYAALYLIAGFLANIVAYNWYLRAGQMVVSVGASGAIFGVMGALIWIVARNKGRVDGLSIRQMLVMLAFSLYFGFAAADVSNIAHLSGLAAGFLLGILLYRKGRTYGKPYSGYSF